MARTIGTKPKIPTILKAVEYCGGSICKMSDGTMQAMITITKGGVIDDHREIVTNRTEGQEFIDSVLRASGSRRTKGIPAKPRKQTEEPSGPFAGYMKNPPEDCKYKVHDKDKFCWVDVYFCAYKCDLRAECRCAEILNAGKKERIKHESN